MRLDVLPMDTTPEAFRVYVEGLRRLSPDKRARMVVQLSDTIRATALAGVRKRHPEYDEQQVQYAVLRLMVGEDVFHQMFPHVKIRP